MLRPLIGEQKGVKIAIIAKEDLEKLWEIDNDPEGARYLRDPGQVFLQNDMEKLLEKLSSDKDTMRIYTRSSLAITAIFTLFCSPIKGLSISFIYKFMLYIIDY